MKDAVAVHRALLERAVGHEIVRLPRVILTADDLPDVLGLPALRCVATRMYDAGAGQLVAVLVPAGATPDAAALLAATGVPSLALARADLVNAVTDFAARLVCPVLLHPSVTVLADAAVGAADVVYTATGDGGTALGIRTRDLLVESGAAVADLHSAAEPAERVAAFAGLRAGVPAGPAERARLLPGPRARAWR